MDEGPRLGHDADAGHAGQHAAQEGGAAPRRHVDEGHLAIFGVTDLKWIRNKCGDLILIDFYNHQFITFH